MQESDPAVTEIVRRPQRDAGRLARLADRRPERVSARTAKQPHDHSAPLQTRRQEVERCGVCSAVSSSDDGKLTLLKSKPQWKWLSHPLFLLLLGGAFTAGITNYLVPSITRQWQNHDKELEIKSALVQNMNRAAFDFFESIRTVEYQDRPKTLAPLDRAYVSWRTAVRVDAAEFDTYFSNPEIDRDWGDVDSTIVLLYSIFKDRSSKGRAVLIQENPRLLEHKTFPNIVAESLRSVDVNTSYGYGYDTDVGELEVLVGERVAKATDQVLHARSSL
jgi:hypothetical protein